jgi:RNA polymerase sigma factor for flagellar operon FliA
MTRRIPVPEDDAGDAVDRLWREYKRDQTFEARERLILHYAPIVKFVAGRVASGLPQSVDQAARFSLS